jgi:hypothetical protein
MGKASLIKDPATRNAVNELEKVLEATQRIRPLKKVEDSTSYGIDGVEYNKLVDAINKITEAYKRR